MEYRCHADDGSVCVMRVSGTPIFDEAGRFEGYRGTGRNVTEAYALSEELWFQAQ